MVAVDVEAVPELGASVRGLRSDLSETESLDYFSMTGQVLTVDGGLTVTFRRTGIPLRRTAPGEKIDVQNPKEG